jgi:hypothetical protein
MFNYLVPFFFSLDNVSQGTSYVYVFWDDC